MLRFEKQSLATQSVKQENTEHHHGTNENSQ